MARDSLFKLRRGTAAAWTSANPTLAAGEPGYETDTGKIKYGDGSTAWASLPYSAADAGLAAHLADTSDAHDASAISFTPAGTIAATDVQAAIEEVATEAGGSVTDATISTSDITTNNASTSKHGWLRKLDNSAAHFLDGQGNWSTPTGTATGMATDPLWDAAGDIAVATGADAAAKLAKGAAGGSLSMLNGAVTWNAGSSFPGSPATGDRYYRTDILGGTEFKYDGTQWRTVNTFELAFAMLDAAAFTGLSATTNNVARMVIPWKGTYGLYALTAHFHTIVVTTNDSGKFWTATLASQPGGTTLGSPVSTASDTASVHTVHDVAINGVVTNTDIYLQVNTAKTSTPGNFFVDLTLSYQLVAT